MYKIFFDDRIILLTGRPDTLQSGGSTLTDYFSNEKDLEQLIRKFNSDKQLKRTAVVHRDLRKLSDVIKSSMKLVDAAGGVVRNEKGQILVIRRLGKWDLPKGKVEKDEKKRQAAMREVREECGINDLEIIRKLPSTYHTYWHNDKLIIKKTRWYEMIHKGNEILRPQKAEDISEIRWIFPEEISEVIKDTYLTIIDVLQHVLNTDFHVELTEENNEM
jgi:8-oxo-dGTP pyrophosphatase MutT (NUDIX family)